MRTGWGHEAEDRGIDPAVHEELSDGVRPGEGPESSQRIAHSSESLLSSSASALVRVRHVQRHGKHLATKHFECKEQATLC